MEILTDKQDITKQFANAILLSAICAYPPDQIFHSAKDCFFFVDWIINDERLVCFMFNKNTKKMLGFVIWDMIENQPLHTAYFGQ